MTENSELSEIAKMGFSSEAEERIRVLAAHFGLDPIMVARLAMPLEVDFERILVSRVDPRGQDNRDS